MPAGKPQRGRGRGDAHEHRHVGGADEQADAVRLALDGERDGTQHLVARQMAQAAWPQRRPAEHEGAERAENFARVDEDEAPPEAIEIA